MSVDHDMRRNAFTLVELLVVMAIILVLIGMLLPTIGVVRERSRRTEARQTLRQVLMGMEAYREEDERKRYPPEDSASHELHRTAIDLLLDRKLLSFPASRLAQGHLLDPWGDPCRYRLLRDTSWWPKRPLEAVDGNGNQALDESKVAGIRAWNWTWDPTRAATAWDASVRLYGTPRQASYPYLWSIGGHRDAAVDDAGSWQLP